jgi:hypothetical protein
LWRLFVSVAGGQVGGLASYIEAIAVVAIGFVVDSQHDDVRNGRMNQGEEGHKRLRRQMEAAAAPAANSEPAVI